MEASPLAAYKPKEQVSRQYAVDGSCKIDQDGGNSLCFEHQLARSALQSVIYGVSRVRISDMCDIFGTDIKDVFLQSLHLQTPPEDNS